MGIASLHPSYELRDQSDNLLAWEPDLAEARKPTISDSRTMKALSRPEGVLWCQANRVALNDRGLPELADADFEFKIPPDAGKRIYLAKQAMEAFANEATVLVWIDDWSVWPSGQRMHIFDRLWISYGENR